MPKIKYVGPFDAVEVPALGRDVKRGEPIEVEDAEIAKSLLEQKDNWQRVSKPAKKAAAKKAATPPPPPADDAGDKPQED